MLSAIAPYILVLWAYSHGMKTVEIPQASESACEKNGHHFTSELGWSGNWDGYQCISTGYKETPHD